jgi:hypothetical protein
MRFDARPIGLRIVQLMSEMPVFQDGLTEAQKVNGAIRLLKSQGWTIREPNPPFPLATMKFELERAGYFVLGPPERAAAGVPAAYDARVWQLSNLVHELNRRLCEVMPFAKWDERDPPVQR